jgi:iron complex transport system substrate-binding protein
LQNLSPKINFWIWRLQWLTLTPKIGKYMPFIKKIHYLFYGINFLIISLISCNSNKKQKLPEGFREIPLEYGQGFKIFKKEKLFLLEIRPSKENDQNVFHYLVGEKPGDFKGESSWKYTKIAADGNAIVLSETTQIPHLVLLDATDKLVAFPNLDLISSEVVREKINQGSIKDLGSGPSLNFEKVIDLSPDWVMLSSFGDGLKKADQLETGGIPVVINNEFLESHPLGRAEWIKFTGILIGKYAMADSVFKIIRDNYLQTKKASRNISEEKRPTVLSGNFYRDIWYAPGGNSWMSQLILDAGGFYVFQHLPGRGSLQLNYEYVLDRAKDADLWIGASDYKNLTSMDQSDRRYRDFKAFQEKKVYTYTLGRGEKGGILYFEEGYLRPDKVVMDLLKIMHPPLAIDHQFQYFTRLHE